MNMKSPDCSEEIKALVWMQLWVSLSMLGLLTAAVRLHFDSMLSRRMAADCKPITITNVHSCNQQS